LKKFSDRFSRFDTIPECDGHPASQQSASHVAVGITALIAQVIQEPQLMLTTGSTRLAVNQGQQT